MYLKKLSQIYEEKTKETISFNILKNTIQNVPNKNYPTIKYLETKIKSFKGCVILGNAPSMVNFSPKFAEKHHLLVIGLNRAFLKFSPHLNFISCRHFIRKYLPEIYNIQTPICTEKKLIKNFKGAPHLNLFTYTNTEMVSAFLPKLKVSKSILIPAFHFACHFFSNIYFLGIEMNNNSHFYDKDLRPFPNRKKIQKDLKTLQDFFNISPIYVQGDLNKCKSFQ